MDECHRDTVLAEGDALLDRLGKGGVV